MKTHQSKIEKLIAELCPNGVEFRELWKITNWDKKFSGIDKTKQKKVLSFKHIPAKKLKELVVENGDIKLLSTGKFQGYTTEELAQEFINEGEVITIPTGGSANIKYHNGKFVDSGNLLCSVSDKNILCLKYLYYYFLEINEKIENLFQGSGVKHPSMPEILELKIPIPPLAIQKEIVRILDTFTELTARKKQYSYYREKLLTFGERKNSIKKSSKQYKNKMNSEPQLVKLF